MQVLAFSRYSVIFGFLPSDFLQNSTMFSGLEEFPHWAEIGGGSGGWTWRMILSLVCFVSLEMDFPNIPESKWILAE